MTTQEQVLQEQCDIEKSAAAEKAARAARNAAYQAGWDDKRDYRGYRGDTVAGAYETDYKDGWEDASHHYR